MLAQYIFPFAVHTWWSILIRMTSVQTIYILMSTTVENNTLVCVIEHRQAWLMIPKLSIAKIVNSLRILWAKGKYTHMARLGMIMWHSCQHQPLARMGRGFYHKYILHFVVSLIPVSHVGFPVWRWLLETRALPHPLPASVSWTMEAIWAKILRSCVQWRCKLWPSLLPCWWRSVQQIRVCGLAYANGISTPDAFLWNQRNVNNYVDGLSVTHSYPRQHIWTFAADHERDVFGCRCSHVSNPPSFVGNNYFCNSNKNGRLWDGQGCMCWGSRVLQLQLSPVVQQAAACPHLCQYRCAYKWRWEYLKWKYLRF